MKISRREDIEAPLDVVFREVTDFAAFERSALRRGVEVSRLDDMTAAGPGNIWAACAQVRSKPREFTIRLASWIPGTAMVLDIDSSGFLATMNVDLVELSRARTRLQVGVEVKAVTMTSRLLLQSAKLAKGSLEKRFAKRVGDFARDIELRHRKAARSI